MKSIRTRTRTALLVLGFAAFLGPALAHGQDQAAEIDKIFAWASSSTPGCAIAVSHQGQVVVNRAYGLADLERNVAITPETVFDAASVVKQFVSAATLLLVEEGRLSLADDIHKYIPELPDYGHTITLDHLMTHTSGIRDWTGLGPLTGRQVDALSLTLRQRGLNFPPGTEWSYSNSGYVLLKEIVSRTSGMPFGEFVSRRIFEPLGMKKTAYLADLRKVVKNRALAYEKSGGEWRLDVQLDDDRGGGGALLSTPTDLLLWNDALTNARLGPFVTEKLQEPARLNNGRTLGYARGLNLDSNRGGRVIWHSGGSAGYGAFLVRFPEQRLSVASMCNAGETATGGTYARRIFEMFVPASGTPGAPQATQPGPAVAIDPTELKGKAGLYFSEAGGQPLRLAVENGRLRVAGGPVLDAVSKDQFRNPRGTLSVMSQDQFELHFSSPDSVTVKSMEGATTRYRRAQPFAPSADELGAFAGRYTNDDSRAVFDVSTGKTGLTLRVGWNVSQAFEFRPVDRDTFQYAGMFVRFLRDKTGHLIGFDYSNPVVRNIRFSRATAR